MPPQTSSDQSHYDEQTGQSDPRFGETPTQPIAEQGPVARRSILRSAVGAGVVGVAAAAGTGVIVAATRPSGAPAMMPVSKPVAIAPIAPGALSGPLVIYVAETKTGRLDVFAGTGETQIHNPALVNQILANLKLA